MRKTIWIILLCVFTVGCSEVSGAAVVPNVEDAEAALIQFFEALSSGRYGEAVELHGGPADFYQVLADMNPDEINVADYQGKEDQGILYVPKAGEILYRLKNPPDWQKA